MENIKTICVYCGASNGVEQQFKQAAAQMGKIIGESGKCLVYGGGRSGLMGIVADATLAAGGQVVGVIPHHLQEREVKHTELTELHLTKDMHTRKKMMMDRADAFVVLAGGLGTLEEFFEVVTWKQLGIHDKPIIVINIGGYWDKLICSIEHIIELGFAKPHHRELFTVIDTPDNLLTALASAPESHLATQSDLV